MDLLSAALVDPEKRANVASLVQKSAFIEATNDAWAFVPPLPSSRPSLIRRQSKADEKPDRVFRV